MWITGPIPTSHRPIPRRAARQSARASVPPPSTASSASSRRTRRESATARCRRRRRTVSSTAARARGEFGAVTGRPRRCGWFDATVVRYAARVNGLTGAGRYQARRPRLLRRNSRLHRLQAGRRAMQPKCRLRWTRWGESGRVTRASGMASTDGLEPPIGRSAAVHARIWNGSKHCPVCPSGT